MQIGLSLRLFAFLGLMGLGLADFDGRQWLALLGLALVVLTWSLLNVDGTALTAHLSRPSEVLSTSRKPILAVNTGESAF